MTREQAVELVRKMMFNNVDLYQESEAFVDTLVALGILKLREP